MKTVFITGSSSGIGLAAAKAFYKEGYNVIINGRDKRKLEDAKTNFKNVTAICADMSDFESAKAAFEKIGSIDILINNAGISYIGLFNLMKHEEWENIIKNNLFSAMNCSNLALQNMIRRNSGNIINISSIWGNAGASCEVAYSASKGAINAFTRALAKEAAPSGIRVNAIACGVIETKMNDFLTAEEKNMLIDEIPASRFGSPEEVAELALFLASEKAQYLNGQVLTLDGAML